MPPRGPEPARANWRTHLRLTLVIAATLGATAAWTAPLSDGQLTALMERIGREGDRRANFTEHKTVAALRQPLVSSGYLVYRRPAYFEKVTTSPRPERVVVDGGTVTIVSSDGESRSIALASQPGLQTLIDTFRGALSGDLALLERSYSVTAESSGGGWVLILAPIDLGLRQVIRAVEIRGSGSTPRVIAIEQANGDSQRLTLTTR